MRSFVAGMARLALVLSTGLFVPTLAGCPIHTRGPGLVSQGDAPAFTLADPLGRRVSLASLSQGGAAVLVFYRGYW